MQRWYLYGCLLLFFFVGLSKDSGNTESGNLVGIFLGSAAKKGTIVTN